MWLKQLVRETFEERFPPKKVLFRVDAGRVEGLSFGHISRCLALAKELKISAGSENIFLMRDYKEGVVYARSSGFPVKTVSHLLPKLRHDNLVADYIEDIKPDSLVVDLPEDDPNYYIAYARRKGILTIVIDDTAKRPFRADVILNSSILACRDKYKDPLPTTRFLLGMDYFIMDDRDIEKRRALNKDYLNILITLGGSDMKGLTKAVIRALSELSLRNIHFTVILGPGFRGRQSVIDASRALKDKITIVPRPKEMKKFFIESDLAICAGGRTLYELYRTGIPCMAIASNKDEASVIKEFIKEGLIFGGLLRWNRQQFLTRLEGYAKKFNLSMQK